MNAQRLSIVLAVLAAFVLGISVGTFVSGSPPSPTEPRTPSGARSPAGSDSPDSSSLDSQRPTLSSGSTNNNDDAITRFWTTLTLSDENERHAAWLALLPTLHPADAQRIRELFLKMEAEGRHYDFEWSSFWPRWGEIDATGALEYLRNQERPEKQPAAAQMILRGWAKSDPAAARAWLAANSATPYYNAALRGYIDGLARTDLDRATAEALSLGVGHDAKGLMDTLADQALQQRSISGMVNWWESLPDGPTSGALRRDAVAAIATRLASVDPARAQTWLAELSSTPYRSDEHIGSVALKVAERDPVGAVAWVASLTPSPADGHYTAIGRTIRVWAQQDRASAERWILSLPPSPLRDQALANFPGQQAQVIQRDVDGVLRSYQRALKN